jgi:ABC-type bacteriocin/lantibiotic exporter with double-glycine peptidase domain
MGLLAFITIASLAEVFSIGAVLPFMGVLTAPEKVYQHEFATAPIRWLRITQPEQLLVPVTVLFCLAALLAAAVRVLATWMRTRLSFATGADLSNEIYRRTLYQPYAVHMARNSSEIIEAMSGKVNTVIYSVLNPLLVLVSNGLMLVMIVGALLLYKPVIAMGTFGGFAAIYFGIFHFTRARLAANSKVIAYSATHRVKMLQEGLGGIRDVLLDNTQAVYCAEYAVADRRLRAAQAWNTVTGESPRFAIEGLGVCLIAVLSLLLVRRPEGFQVALPLVGTMAIAATRLLPLLQQMYFAVSNLGASKQSLTDTLTLLEQPVPESAALNDIAPLPFERVIECHGVGFRYNTQGPWQLREVTLTIPKGSRVGIVGTTGSGKSTFLDIIMGLLHPMQGFLSVDGCSITTQNEKQWQRRIAHVPQAIYLSDATVAENIAFGVPRERVNMTRVVAAAQAAQLDETIAGWAKRYDTLVGERGVRLSGGQRQRIGIARALYKQADVLLFDEATSALDMGTESRVMDSIATLDGGLTILMVAHRLQSLRGCDHVVRLEDGRLVASGTYEEVAALMRVPA